MSNSLNLTASNFTNSVNKAFLDDVTMQIAIIDSSTGQAGTFYPIGKFKADGKNLKIDTEYAELLTGIPQAVADKAMIKRSYMYEADLVNLQSENIALVMGAYLDDSGTDKRVIFGETVPATLEVSVILSGQQRDGKDLDIYIRKAQITPESIELMLGAPEFASIKMQLNIVPDPHPHKTNFSWDVVSDYSLSSASCAGSTGVWTMATTTGATAGDYVYSAANGFLGIILSVTPSTSITLDRNCGAESSVTLKGVDPLDILRDNIMFIVEEA